jgi:hypothetical protein
MSKTAVFWMIVVIVIMTIASPILFIWSLNTLFALNIAYGFLEWLAALLILGVIRGDGVKFKKE